jgi:thiol-disulfide isomerase/thioredoxin
LKIAGRRVLLVFTQSGCGPCKRVMPELNRLQAAGDLQVLVVNNGELKETRAWAAEARACFPIAVQDHYSLSRRYEVFATPFAFLIDEKGVITSKGIVNNRQHINYILDGALARKDGHADRDPTGAVGGVSEDVRPSSVLT